VANVEEIEMTKENTLQEVEKQEVEVAEGAERTRTCKAYIPRADIYETDSNVVIVADMPGVDENSLDITLEKNVLSIVGSVDFDRPDSFGLAYAEYDVGDYERKFTISNEIDRESIEATVKDGVLRVYLAKAAPAKTRRIDVKSHLN
jgi:HSP20 family molecular chaperone IbpA